MAKRLPVKDESKNYCGEMIIDVIYTEEVKEKVIVKEEVSIDRGPVKTI